MSSIYMHYGGGDY